jgi:hypothetical protein
VRLVTERGRWCCRSDANIAASGERRVRHRRAEEREGEDENARGEEGGMGGAKKQREGRARVQG